MNKLSFCGEDRLEWKQIVTSSSRIMRKFTFLSYENRNDRLYLDNDEENEGKENRMHQIAEQLENLEEQMAKYSFRNIVIFFPEISLIPVEKYFKIVENYFIRIERLKMVSPNVLIIMRTLSFTSSTLKELKFCLISDDKVDEFQQISMPKLKTIEIKGSTKILKNIQAENLRTIVLKNYRDEDHLLENFLQTTRNLKIMKLESEFLIDLVKIPFKLEHFEMTDIKTPNFLLFFKTFLLFQRESLKCLKVTQRVSDCKEILAFAIEYLRLETLECLGRLEIHQNTEILEIMTENSTIKNLDIGFSAYNRNSIVHLDNMDMELKIIKKCKALETLKIDYLNGKFENFLKEIQDSNLKSFEVRFGNSVEPTRVKYEKLEVLSGTRVGFETEMRSLVNFTAGFPNIKKLVFGFLSIHSYAEYFHQIFTSCKNLEEIEIKKLSGNVSDLYDALNSEDCPLKVLKIGVSKIPEARTIEEKFKDVSFNVKLYSTSDQHISEWGKMSNSYDLCIYDDDDY